MSWNADAAYAFTPYKILTLPLGVWPLQKYNTFSLVRSIVCCMSLAMMVILLFFEINFGNSDTYVNVDNFVIVFCFILALLKILFFRIYANNLTYNFSSAVNDYLMVDTEEKRTIMRRHAFMGRFIFYSILLLAYITSSIFMLIPILADDTGVQINVSIKNQLSELPIPLTFLGDVHMSTTMYVLVSTAEYFVLMLSSTSYCGNDSVFLAIMLHVCGQMELLKSEFINYDMKNINKSFSDLASRHCYLIENAKLLTDVISFVLLVQVLSSCLLISMIGFQFILALNVNDLVTITKSATAFSTIMLQLFFYSFVGDYLKCQMEDMAFSIYSCNWHNFSSKLMRNVMFVIMRSQQPVELLAGKFFVVNIKSYMTILKSSLSYLSVLRVMMDT